jgi:hypothetical protein
VNQCADGNAPVLAHDVCAAGTIFGMKPLPQIHARNRMRPATPARKQLIAAIAAAALWVVSLGAPAAVNADIPCRQWRFNGYTQFNFQDGRKMQFEWFAPWIPEPGQETIDIPPDGGGVGGIRLIYGGVKDSPNGIWMKRHATYSPDSDVSWFTGGVADDGFAYGITWDATGNYSNSWRSAEPLMCADNGG